MSDDHMFADTFKCLRSPGIEHAGFDAVRGNDDSLVVFLV